MRRLLAVVAVLFLSACSDRHAQGPFGPFGSPQATVVGDKNDGFWLLGQTWTTIDGRSCTFVEDYVDPEDGLKKDGTLCEKGDDPKVVTFTEWAYDNNTDLYPVVEICRVVPETGKCSNAASESTFFVRPSPGQVLPEGDISVPNLSNGKYVLGQKGEDWWDQAALGTYRIIVAIAFTGEDNFSPGWNEESSTVLGYFDKVRKLKANDKGDNLNLRFRIAEGALCDKPNPDDCVMTAFDPDEPFTLILDDQFNQYNEDESFGVVGIKFPALGSVLQQRINVIFERVTVGPNDKCLEEQPASGKEVGPCYSVRTEPYIDLDAMGYTGTDLIEFVICYDAHPESRLWKWSYVKTKLDRLDKVEGDFIKCDGGSASAAPAAPRHLAGLGGIRSRLMTAASRVLMPAPLHARRRTSKFGGDMINLSNITLVEPEDIRVNFTTPIAPGSDAENIGEVDGVFTAKVQCLSQLSGTCPDTAISVPGTAHWDAVNRVYQVNWNTPRTQPAGEYAAQVYRDGLLVAGSAQFSIRSSGSGPSYYTHNAGRTLPIKFFLSWLE
jgi:hypothetical protein